MSCVYSGVSSVQLNTDKQKIFDQPVVRTAIKSTINLWNSTIVLKFYNCMMVAYRVGGGGGEGEEGLVVSKDW